MSDLPKYFGRILEDGGLKELWRCEHIHENRSAAVICAHIKLEDFVTTPQEPKKEETKAEETTVVEALAPAFAALDAMEAAGKKTAEPEIIEQKQEDPASPQQVIAAQPVADIFVYARNPQEMAEAQEKMVVWADSKLLEKRNELIELEKNFEIAKKSKWNTKTARALVIGAQKKVDFYTKIKGALEEGFVIIPSMPIDVFAVRTTKEQPKGYGTTEHTWSRPWVPDQVTNNPPMGEGDFVSVRAKEAKDSVDITKPGSDQKKMIRRAWADEFKEVDFPFHLAKPAVLSATAQAMVSKTFDEIGVLPRQRRGDPMVIGRVNFKHGKQEKSVSFLIAWFIDTKDL